MPSRMDRYYRQANNIQKRTIKNQELYKTIYDDSEYTNIEGIATIEKSNEIDINKIQEMLKNRDEYKKQRETQIAPKSRVDFLFSKEEDKKEKNYDIKEVLIKAKDSRTESEESKKLRNTQYNILKNINLKDNNLEKDNGDLKEIINTITNNSMLEKIGDSELSLDLLKELKSSNTMVGDSKSINAILKDVILEEEKEKKKDEPDDIDKTFFTSSLNFNNNDFEELKNINSTLRKNNILIKILMFMLVVIILSVVVYSIYKFVL